MVLNLVIYYEKEKPQLLYNDFFAGCLIKKAFFQLLIKDFYETCLINERLPLQERGKHKSRKMRFLIWGMLETFILLSCSVIKVFYQKNKSVFTPKTTLNKRLFNPILHKKGLKTRISNAQAVMTICVFLRSPKMTKFQKVL